MKNFPKINFYNEGEALAFSDVYLKPSYSDIKSRYSNQIDTSTEVAKGAPKLNIPFISSGMDTVTGAKMAEVLSLNGGLGEIHRNNTPSQQAEMVRIVKEKMRTIETNPPMVSVKAKISDALNLLEKRNRGYVLVFKGDKFEGNICGIATNKDFNAGNNETLISKVMTSVTGNGIRKLITAKDGTSLTQAVKIMRDFRIEKLPVLDKANVLLGVYTLKDYELINRYPNAATDNRGRLIVGAAIGVHEVDVERALLVVEAGVDVIFLDIAHGHSVYTKEMIRKLKVKENIKIPIIVGNIATYDGALFAYEAGADGIKVGIGPGFVCKTRNVAGTGVPQITAVLEVSRALKNIKKALPIISDGGVREPGDPSKAIACGADTVMIGSLFAGTDMSPGDTVRINGTLQKRVRGMASKGVLEDRKKISSSTTNITVYAPEGRETFTPYQGSTQELLMEYVGGLRSAMSYTGSHSIKELKNAHLIHVSGFGSNEQGRPLN